MKQWGEILFVDGFTELLNPDSRDRFGPVLWIWRCTKGILNIGSSRGQFVAHGKLGDMRREVIKSSKSLQTLHSACTCGSCHGSGGFSSSLVTIATKQMAAGY